jgi:hypothetical protein
LVVINPCTIANSFGSWLQHLPCQSLRRTEAARPAEPRLKRGLRAAAHHRLTKEAEVSADCKHPNDDAHRLRDRRFVKYQTTTVKQNGEPVQVLVMNLLAQSRLAR